MIRLGVAAGWPLAAGVDAVRLASPAREFLATAITAVNTATGVPNVVAGSRASLTAPLLADPGEAFIYGINIDWLGKVVEAVTGVGLDVAMKQGVTGPLGMDQTTFLMNDDQRPNSTPVHVKGEDGSWVSIGEVLNQAPDYWAGGHGLYGPPSDYIRFERALLRGGELDGTRILQQSTIDAAFANQIGDLDFPADLPTADPASSCSFQVGPGFKFGYGLLLNTTDIPGMRRAWSGAWAGLCNTHFWVDRAAGICASIYSNFLPFVTPEAVQVYNDFESAPGRLLQSCAARQRRAALGTEDVSRGLAPVLPGDSTRWNAPAQVGDGRQQARTGHGLARESRAQQPGR